LLLSLLPSTVSVEVIPMRELSMEQIEYAIGRLVRLVEIRGVKQTQLEHASGVNQSTISKILSRSQDSADHYTPSEEILRKLFQGLGLKLSDILNETDEIPDEILGYLATPLTGLDAKCDNELRRIVAMVQTIAAANEFTGPAIIRILCATPTSPPTKCT
jgi:transcriptional regulator with XRE-family HTH domain